jgi:signal transduction histidine kinase
MLFHLRCYAIKFTPEGGQIEVSAVPNDGFVEVSVTDTGIGIAPEDQEKVFEGSARWGHPRRRWKARGWG